MKTLNKVVLLSILPLTILLAFNNCSQVAFDESQMAASLGSADVGIDSGSSNNSDVPADDLKEVFVNCQNGTLKESNVVLEFPKEQNSCAWGVNGNLSQLDSHVQARHEQSVSVNLPQGALVCAVEFASQKVNMVYDDQILLTLNDSVLMSSSKSALVGSFASRSGIPQYRWNEIVGLKMDVQVYDPYCLGSDNGLSSCTFPASEKSGDMELIFGSSVIQTIMAMDLSRTTHTFKFITTGDNDSSDCKHNAFSMPLKIKYVIK